MRASQLRVGATYTNRGRHNTWRRITAIDHRPPLWATDPQIHPEITPTPPPHSPLRQPWTVWFVNEHGEEGSLTLSSFLSWAESEVDPATIPQIKSRRPNPTRWT